MSLINKMLQDLDARGSQAGSGMQSDIKSVAMPERRLPVLQMALAAGVTLAALVIIAVLWWKRAPATPPVVVQAAAVPPAPPKVAQAIGRQVPLAVAQATPAAAPLPVAAPKPAPARKIAVAPAKVVAVADSEAGVAVANVVHAAPAVAPVSGGGRDMTDAQRSETEYRQALAALDEGRVAAAIALLEQTLKLNAHHDAARQSLVTLLVEAGRNDEAMRQLEQGLTLDPAQPALAMLLARMQIERGTSGVATLLRTLPSAEGNADYHAFLAGALQREQRHKEALAQYAAALRTAPGNGVWLMGMGISLQAEQRPREALDAFQRAKASGTLSAPLASFVDRKIEQLAN